MSREAPETMWLTFPVEVPRENAITEHQITLRVVAAGAESDATLEYTLRIGRNPNL